MPLEVTELKWKCVHCGKEYKTSAIAKACEESHDFVFVKLTRLELKKLIQFLYTGDLKVLPPDLPERLANLDRLGV